MPKEIQGTASKLPPVMLTNTPVPEGVFLRASRLIRLLIVVSIISEGISETPSLTCPDLQPSSVGKANCSIGTTKFNRSGCFPLVVKFEFNNRSEEAVSPLCQTPYKTCGQELDKETMCSCTKSDAGVNIFQLNIPGNETYEGGMLRCTVECLSGSSHSVTCGPLVRDPLTTGTYSVGLDGCVRELTTTEKLLMGLFIPIGVATIALVAYEYDCSVPISARISKQREDRFPILTFIRCYRDIAGTTLSQERKKFGRYITKLRQNFNGSFQRRLKNRRLNTGSYISHLRNISLDRLLTCMNQ